MSSFLSRDNSSVYYQAGAAPTATITSTFTTGHLYWVSSRCLNLFKSRTEGLASADPTPSSSGSLCLSEWHSHPSSHVEDIGVFLNFLPSFILIAAPSGRPGVPISRKRPQSTRVAIIQAVPFILAASIFCLSCGRALRPGLHASTLASVPQ